MGCAGSSESTFVKMPRCWKSHTVADAIVNTVTVFFFFFFKCTVQGSIIHSSSTNHPFFSNHVYIEKYGECKQFACLSSNFLSSAHSFLQNILSRVPPELQIVDRNQDQHLVGPDLVPSSLPMLTTDDTGR